MIRIIGPDWPSKRLLEETLVRNYPQETQRLNLRVSWGLEGDYDLNGMPRRDGFEQLEDFDSSELKYPEATRALHTALQWVHEGHLVFGRKLIHTHGNDIVGPRHRAWRRREFWVKVIPNIAQEWRMNIFCGSSIARGLKVQVEAPWRKMPVRNRANGWHMTHDTPPPKGVRSLAKAALQAVGYDFGAVDILVDEAGAQYVLEVNKAPGLDNYSASAYATAIVEYAKENV